MADDNGLDSSQPLHLVYRLGVYIRHHVPENIPLRRANQHGALSNGEFWTRMDGNDALVMLIRLELVVMIRIPKLRHGRKGLARWGNILARIVTDVARLDGGAISSWELRAAGIADEPRGGLGSIIGLWSEIHGGDVVLAMVMVKLVAMLRMALELLLLQGRAGLGNRLCRAGGDFGPLLSLDLRPFVNWSRFYYAL